MLETARPAVAGDLPALHQLYEAATAELRVERGGEVWAASTARHRPHLDLDDPAVCVLAGTIDDVVVGYARVHAEPLPGERQLAVLTDIYVDPGAREVGVGESLLDAAIGWARDRGAVGIDSIALPGMRGSKNFFEAAGLVARAIIVHKALP